MTESAMPYESDRYWENRGGPSYKQYTESPQYRHWRTEQFKFFSRLVSDLRPERLLDFACGTGKLFPLWTEIPEVHGYDRARSQIMVAREEAARVRPEQPYRLMHCPAEGKTETPYDDDYFDLVVAAEVLLHVVPGDVEALMDELHRICRGHVAIVTAAPFDNPASHCFNHDYTALCRGRFDLIDDHCALKQRFLVGRKVGAQTETRQPEVRGARKEMPDAVLTA